MLETSDPILPTSWGQLAFMSAVYLVLSARRIVPVFIDLGVSWANNRRRRLDAESAEYTTIKEEDDEKQDP